MRRRTMMLMAALAAGGRAALQPGRADAAVPGGAERTQAIAAAASGFLDTLGADQRRAATFAFPTGQPVEAAGFKGGLNGRMSFVGERFGDSVWSNFPVSDVPRPGLQMGSLRPEQRDAVTGLLRQMLSERGFAKVQDIMGSDQALADGGTPFQCGRDAYTLAVLGTPGLGAPWMVQFGGHHLALNLVMDGARAALLPVLTGAQPANYAANGRSVRALAAENDKAFALLHALDAAQRRQATVDHPVSDLVSGPGLAGAAVPPGGLKAADMGAVQRGMLLDLVGEWAGMVNDDHAAPRLAEIAAGLDDTVFAWSGLATHEPGRNGSSYFRIHGLRLLIEFAPQRPGGDLTMHVHTVYRDPEGDYGRALTPG